MLNLIRPMARSVRAFVGSQPLTRGGGDLYGRLTSLETKMAALTRTTQTPDAASRPAAPDAVALDYIALTGDPPIPDAAPSGIKGGSRLCRQGDYSTDAFRYWMARMRQPITMQRKWWEWFFMADALHQRGVLRPGSHGVGFGVGQEPLPALFASLGCDILATDMSLEDAGSAGWASTGQHASELDGLNLRGICDPAAFQDRVRFRTMDMNDIPAELDHTFDFCWSSCAFEHLGSLEHGLRFVEASMRTLKPGGVAVHTTEYNMSSDTDTLQRPELSLYRRRDLQALTVRLEAAGHRVEPFDWDHGQGFADGYIDWPPYFSTPLHLRLRIADFDCTSVGFIVHKAQASTA